MGADVTGRTIEVVGDGVLLAPWSIADVPGVLEIAADSETRAWSQSLRPVRTAAAARAWLAPRMSDPDRCDWAVRDRSTGRLVGRVGLHRFEPIGRSAEIGYGVHPAHRRRGVAVRAVAAATGFGFTHLGLARIGLIHAIGNGASCRVAARSGYAYEGLQRAMLDHGDGLLHDAHLHGRLATDPAGPAAPAPIPLTPVEVPLGDVLLRPWRADDAPALLAAATDPEVVRQHDPLPDRDLDSCRAWIVRRNQRWATGTDAPWAVVEAATASLVGSGTLHDIDRSLGTGSVTVWTVAGYRRRGIATRVLHGLATYAFGELGLHRLALHHTVGDEAACAAARAAGFAPEGTTRGSDLRPMGRIDEHLHARLSTDPSVRSRTLVAATEQDASR